MADDDRKAPPQRYWFPYWTSPPVPGPRPALRPQPSRRDTRPAQPQPPPVTHSPSRRQPQPAQPAAAAVSRGAGGGDPAQAQPQPTRLSSRPSPSRAHPLSPIREPNGNGGAPPAPASAPKETKPQAKPATQPTSHSKELDIVVPQEKIIHEPPSDTKAHSKAVEKEKEKEKEKKEKEKEKDGKEKTEKEKEHKEKEKDKDGKEKKEKEKEHKEKEKDKDGKEKEKEKEHKERKEKDHKDKDGKEKKEKEKEHKEHQLEKEKEKDHKEKEKEKEHKEKKDKHKEEHAESKLHKELKAGVADMVHKLGATTTPSAGHHERHASGVGTTVITLAGENKGASMKISHAEAESKDAAAARERRARKLDDGKQHEAYHGAKGLTAFVNSNVQVVNNSLVLQSSCSSSDPGVHLKLSTKSKKKGDGEEAGGKGGVAATTKKK